MTSQGAPPSPDGDELRARHYLRALGARPLGHQETTMPDQPITPTRIIPAGAHLPARAPAPGEAPPWRTPPPPPPVAPAPLPVPPDPDQRIVEIRHVHEIVLTSPDLDPDPPIRLWARLWDAMITWRMAAAILAALIPWIGGRSPVGIWSHTVHQARTEASIGAAYAIAAVAIAAAWAIDHHSSPPGHPSRALPRFLLVTAMLGSFGVLHWWDPILLITGVQH